MADVKAVKRYMSERTEELTRNLPPDDAMSVYLHIIQHAQAQVAGIESRQAALRDKPADNSDRVSIGEDISPTPSDTGMPDFHS